MARSFLGFLAAVTLIFLSGCDEPAPIKVGFISGLTGRSADIGEASRNAVQLAVEKFNEAGGIDGRKIELLVRDDTNDPEVAGAKVRELHAAGAEAIIGPNVSAIAAGMVPVLNELKIVAVSPTVSSQVFVDIDDYFFRINWSTSYNARLYAKHYFDLGYRRVAAAVDNSNRVFSGIWLREFTDAFEDEGGEVVGFEAIDSKKNDSYANAARTLLSMDAEALLLIANSVDTAQLAQQIRKFNADVLLIATGWASSERLLALGGRTIEGLELAHSFNRDDKSERFLAFRETYRNQFQQEPDFASVAGYDAATVLFAGLAARDGAESLKEALLNLGEVQGLQQKIAFNHYGDSQRSGFFVVVQDGQFVTR